MSLTNDFCYVILSYGRAETLDTLNTLKKAGAEKEIFIVVGTDDPTVDEYKARYGDKLWIFNKDDYKPKIQLVTPDGSDKVIVYARNACFDLVCENTKYQYFIMLDDDYTSFQRKERFIDEGLLRGHVVNKGIDEMFGKLVEFLAKTQRVSTISMAQTGDWIGGIKGKNRPYFSRKAMNSFTCDINRPIPFMGRINEDVNAYTLDGSRGGIYLQIWDWTLKQRATQKNKGGMTDTYLDGGTYLKSMYSVVLMPSAVSVKRMGNAKSKNAYRIHHKVNWRYCIPKIIREEHKK
jgi:hypothetical protein